ncbi:MAG: glycosyltransferase family 39 protein [Bacteroidota bacterium]|nr:glycosyltransferase family 39 protein [Bacteroidota bacterium]
MNSDRRITLLLGVALLLLYAASHSANLSSAHDAANYLRMIRDGDWFHPHHLLFNGAAALWIAAWQSLFPSLPAITLVAWLNAVFGAGCVMLVHMLLRARMGLSPRAALLAALLPAFSFGLWFYSTTVEVYVIPLFFLLVALYLLTAEEPPIKHVLLAAFAHALAMLFHQVHVLFTVPALLLIYLRHRRRGGPPWQEGPRRPAFAYLLTAGFGALIPYLLVGTLVLGHTTPRAYFAWLFRYAGNSDFWHAPGFSSLIKAVIGFGKSIIGGEFLFALPDVRALLQRLLPHNWLADEQYLVRHMPEWQSFVLVALTAALVLLLSWLLLRASWRAAYRRNPEVFTGIAAFFVTYALFFLFWEPANPEFWIPQSVLFFILLAAAALDGGEQARVRRNRTLVHAIVLLLLLINAAGSIRWLRAEDGDMYAVQARAMTAAAGEDGAILLVDPWILQEIIALESGCRVLSVTGVLAEAQGNAGQAWKRLHQKLETLRRSDAGIVIAGEVLAPPEALLHTHWPSVGEVGVQLRRHYQHLWEKKSSDAGKYFHIR